MKVCYSAMVKDMHSHLLLVDESLLYTVQWWRPCTHTCCWWMRVCHTTMVKDMYSHLLLVDEGLLYFNLYGTMVEDMYSYLLLVNEGLLQCYGGGHVFIPAAGGRGFGTVLRWRTWYCTCCWWMRVCLSRTLFMLCSIAYFLALVTASLWEKDSLAGVNSFCSRFPPGPCTSEPDCASCGTCSWPAADAAPTGEKETSHIHADFTVFETLKKMVSATINSNG